MQRQESRSSNLRQEKAGEHGFLLPAGASTLLLIKYVIDSKPEPSRLFITVALAAFLVNRA